MAKSVEKALLDASQNITGALQDISNIFQALQIGIADNTNKIDTVLTYLCEKDKALAMKIGYRKGNEAPAPTVAPVSNHGGKGKEKK